MSAPRRPLPLRGVSLADAAGVLRAAALARAIDEPDCADRIVPLLEGRFALRPHTVDLAVDATIREAAHDLLTHGWTPQEVHHFAARRLDPAALSYLLDALAATVQWTVAPPWLAELKRLDARMWWTTSRPHVAQWAKRHERRRADALRVAVDVLALLGYLPRTDHPQPGMPARVDLPPGAELHDERVAGKVDALLARAADTGYADEAAACAAKAQELLLRYADTPAVRRQVLRDPRRLVAAVGAEVAGLLHKAATAFAKRPAGELTAASRPLPAGEHG